MIMQFVTNNWNKLDTNGMELSDFDLLLKSVIQAGYFRFDSTFYKQLNGLGMGVKPAPPFAIIYVYCTVELPLLQDDYTYTPNAPRKPADLPQVDLWDRYVDDCFSIIEGDEDTVKSLFSYINSLNSDIQFTFECSDKCIAFLDLNIHMNTSENKLDFSLFVKPTSQDIFLNYFSAHPRKTILSAARNEIRRAITNSSSTELQKTSISRITEMLKRNDFPDHVVSKLVQETLKCQEKDRQPKVNANIAYLCLPYINEQTCRKVYYTLRKHQLLESTRVTFTSGQRLMDLLTKSSLQHTKCNKQSNSKCYQCDKACMTKNICYQLKCNICQQTYIGETGRFKRSRTWEHYKAVRDKNNTTAMGKHYQEEHPDIPCPSAPFELTVRRRCKDFVDRQLWQSVLIKRENPKINTQLSESVGEGDWRKYTWKIM